ncbi:hypothetical protein LTR10_018188 [Elasticomyces elasticus]|uniref:Major facilitator superfamily (MFS) profile domain-containing protein n=1 Tax=Exophiala sideris TaxID=1016849 RepID=A0ABR0J2L3_9EURO|nr:hypothetical protein LTR10_018188 [Elasticomyces elasticus]KAK5024931.1 hypothetical protein LTS07_008309 [Exophiala sideris]KAK5031480.1 hypothetical protein LTR13_007808 [Exophiala sideris]KAK5054970.1 hypothetical protein LTR69_008538 [Exophiala sideris]KAK5179850.1 hypothetical protein LTR44_007666 [Eurotiomycetes sp. CCFEE 6388]
MFDTSEYNIPCERKEGAYVSSSSSSALDATSEHDTGAKIGQNRNHASRKNVVEILPANIAISDVQEQLLPAPDGGTLAWTQVAMAHLVVINTWGVINSFGVFQTYYVSALNRASADISWIGSMQVFFLFSVGVLTGRLTDAGYFRPTFALGSLLAVLGSFLASISTTYIQLFFAQGVCIGVGMGCLFCPIVAVVSTYFRSRRNLAMGIAISGSASGGIFFPLMVRELLPRLGFSWTMRCLGFVQLASLLIANAFTRTRVPPSRAGPLIEWNAFKDPVFTFFALGSFFNFWGVYFAFYYIGSYSRNIIGLDYPQSINLLMIIHGVGAIGRIVPGLVADRWCGPLNVIIPATAVCTVMLYTWSTIHSMGGLYAFVIIYGIPNTFKCTSQRDTDEMISGIFGATVQGIFPAALASLTTDLTKAGSRMGLVFSIVSFATLTGPPLGGLLMARNGGQYHYACAFVGTSLLLGLAFSLACRFAKGGFVWKVKI